MSLSAQNTRLPELGADIRPPQPEPLTARAVLGAVNLLQASREPLRETAAISTLLKPVCGPDDLSDAGPWATRPAYLVDGADRRVLRAAGAA